MTLPVGSNLGLDRPVYSNATFPATVKSGFKLHLEKRATTNEIKHKLLLKQGVEAAVDLPANESHATANISLLAR